MTMNVGKRTTYKPVETGYILDGSRPVIAYVAEIGEPVCADSHSHPRAQLIYASSGVMRVRTDRGMWVVPPMQAVWLPPYVEHQVDFPECVFLRNLFFDPSCADRLPDRCFVLSVSPFLRELIAKFCRTDDVDKLANLSAVVIDEIADAKEEPFSLPAASSPALVRIMQYLDENPSCRRTLDEWAAEANTSTRNFARTFLKETGMTFGGWRKRLKIIKAVQMLSSGKSVTEAAYDLGYQSISAFIESFRKEAGSPPAKYLKSNVSL